jgi:hypothetical protein
MYLQLSGVKEIDFFGSESIKYVVKFRDFFFPWPPAVMFPEPFYLTVHLSPIRKVILDGVLL